MDTTNSSCLTHSEALKRVSEHGTRLPGAQDFLEAAAYISGRRDGLTLFSPLANPHPEGSAQHEQWRQGFNSAQAEQALEEQKRNDLLPPCRFHPDLKCTCGGRGLCSDIA